MNRSSGQAQFFDTIADQFEMLDNKYDLARRLDIVFEELLGGQNLAGKSVLDAGCGYGAFSKRCMERGANTTCLDVSPRLVGHVASVTGCRGIVADACDLGVIAANTFDVVVSSEMIEHTDDPRAAVLELCRVLKPGGMLALTTPNRAWQGVVRLASRLHARNFNGLENFCAWREIETWIGQAGLDVCRHAGFHAWPFQIPLHGLSRLCDRRFSESWLARFMINQAILATKRGDSTAV